MSRTYTPLWKAVRNTIWMLLFQSVYHPWRAEADEMQRKISWEDHGWKWR